MKKIIFILFLFIPVLLSGQSEIINFDPASGDPADSSFTSIDVDTVFFANDSTYITGDGDTITITVDDVDGMYITSDGSKSKVVVTDTFNIADLASSNTLVLTPTSTGNVDTLETTDITEVTLDTLDVDYIEANSRLIVSPVVSGSAAEPSLAFGDGNTGFYESNDNVLAFTCSGVQYWQMLGGILYGNGANRPSIRWNTDSDATTPVYHAKRDDTNTGVGSAGSDSLSLIAGGVEGIRVAEGGGAIKVTVTDTLEIKGAGTLSLHETTTPGAVSDYGKIYTKSDNKLYFQDGAGNEHLVTLGASDYGEMGNVEGSVATEVLAEADQWYGCYHANINAGELLGWTYTDGQAGVIASTGTTPGSSVTINDVGHGLSVGDWIFINGTTSYNGVYEVATVPNSDSFTIAETNSEADEGGGNAAWQEGSYLECATAGFYRGVWTANVTQSESAARTTHLAPFINGTGMTKAYSRVYLENTNDIAQPHGNGLIHFSVGDRIHFGVKTSDAQTINFLVRNVSIH